MIKSSGAHGTSLGTSSRARPPCPGPPAVVNADILPSNPYYTLPFPTLPPKQVFGSTLMFLGYVLCQCVGALVPLRNEYLGSLTILQLGM